MDSPAQRIGEILDGLVVMAQQDNAPKEQLAVTRRIFADVLIASGLDPSDPKHCRAVALGILFGAKYDQTKADLLTLAMLAPAVNA